MKKLVIIVLVLVIGVIGWRIGLKNVDEQTEVSEFLSGEKNEESKMNNPFSITALSQREYNSDLKIENEVRRTDRFVSYKISYDSDGLKQYALMNKPTGNQPESGWPVVIVNHGYIPPEVYSTENSYINTSAYFANAGFLVLKPDYRGHDNSEGESGGLVSRITYAVDVMNLMGGILSLDGADENRIFMYGHSMGGDVTLRILEMTNQVQAATLWAPAVNTFPEGFMYFARRNPTTTGRLERFTAELKQYFPDENYDEVDTLLNVDRVNRPVNIHHGTRDESVPFSWGEQLEQKFKDEGKTVYFYTYSNDNHDISGNWSTALNRDIELFRKN